MTGYLYRSNWNAKEVKWGEEQLVSPFPITEENIDEIVKNFEPDYGRFEICASNVADTQFVMRDIDNNVLDFTYCKELLPWE